MGPEPSGGGFVAAGEASGKKERAVAEGHHGRSLGKS